MLGPLFGKELLEMARRRRFFVVRVLIGAALLFGWWVALAGQTPTVAFANLHTLSAIGSNLFHAWAYWSLWGVVALTPMLVCGLIAAEKDGKTFETLLTTLLTNREIIVGKTASRLFLMLILIGSGVPILSVASLYGGFDAAEVASAAAVIAATCLFVVVVGLYYSAVTFKPYIALLRTYFFLAILWWLIPAIIGNLRPEDRFSPWGMLRQVTSSDEPPVQWVTPNAGQWGTPAARIPFGASRAGGPTTGGAFAFLGIWGPIITAALIHLVIAVVLFLRTNHLLRQRLIPGKPPWIFRASTALYRSLISGARSSVERRKNRAGLSNLWTAEEASERWHRQRLERVIEKNPLVYRNRVANAFDPERFVAAIQVVVSLGAVLTLVALSLFASASGMEVQSFERIGLWALVGSTILHLACSTILAACAFARERQYGSWEVLMLVDLSPRRHLAAALRGVLGSLRLLTIVAVALTVMASYVWGGMSPTISWGLGVASLWLLVVSHSLFASLCHRRIAGALAATVFGLAIILVIPSFASTLLAEYSFALFLLLAIAALLVHLFGRQSRWTMWPHLLSAILSAGVLMLVSNLMSGTQMRFTYGNPEYGSMYDWRGLSYAPRISPLSMIFAPMEWRAEYTYSITGTAGIMWTVPPFLAAAAVNVVLFLTWFKRLSKAEPGGKI